jgi:hypothetical protein
MLHLRNMELRIIKILDWITFGYISSLQYKVELYKKEVSVQRKKLSDALANARESEIELMKELNLCRELISQYKAKENKIREQKRKYYHINKNK